MNLEPPVGLGNRYMVGSHGRGQGWGQGWSPLEDSRAWYQGIAKWSTRLWVGLAVMVGTVVWNPGVGLRGSCQEPVAWKLGL